MNRPRSTNGRAPWILVGLGALTLIYLVLPIAAIFIRADWGGLFSTLGSTESRDALRLSVQTTLASAAICVIFGVPLAWLLARTTFVGQQLVRALVTLPLVLPPVVGGVALLLAFGRKGVIGEPLLDWTGISFPYTLTGVVMAQVFVALPFTVITVEGVFRSSDAAYDDAAAVLGANRWRTFWRVTVPMTLPGIAAGAVLSWARALGEFGATVTFAGNFPGVTRTMPTQIYLVANTDPSAATTLSLVLVVTCVVVLVVLRSHWWRRSAV